MSRSKAKQPESEVRWDLIRSYALAQHHMGIEKTLSIKREICGYDGLDGVPLPKLRKLVNELRKLFKIDFKNRDREKKIKEGHDLKKTKELPNDPKGEGTLEEETNEKVG